MWIVLLYIEVFLKVKEIDLVLDVWMEEKVYFVLVDILELLFLIELMNVNGYDYQ